MFNALTIDVEDYYMVTAFEGIVKFEDWPKYESRVEVNTRKDCWMMFVKILK